MFNILNCVRPIHCIQFTNKDVTVYASILIINYSPERIVREERLQANSNKKEKLNSTNA